MTALRTAVPPIAAIIRASRRVYQSPCFDVRICRCDGVTLPCPGQVIMVTPRASGSAVQRNVFKRRIRAVFRLHPSYAQEHYWVLFAKSLLPACTFAHIANVVAQLWGDLAPK